MDDRRAAWEMRSDGSYVQREPGRRRDKRSSQDKLIALAEKRLKAATRLGKKIKKGRRVAEKGD
jgi:hypothetical protein